MSSDYLPALLEALQEAVFILDEKRHVLYTNPIAEGIFGRGYIGNDFVHVVRQPHCLSTIAAVMADGKTRKVKFSLDMPFNASYRMIVADLGRGNKDGARLALTMTDVSDKRAAEQMRTDFVANVSHELRSPLTAISGFIETLRTSAKGDVEASERFLSLMGIETDRMVRLIADLLSLSKVQASQRLWPKGRADVAAVLARVKNSLSGIAEKEKTEIILNTNGLDCTVPGGEDELTQVFQNLVENAVKYSHANSTISIDVSRAETFAGISGPALCVAVQDESDGIAQEHIFRLTERFYRVDTHRSRDKGGTGLGLAITKHIITRHRGRLLVKSKIGIGSTFTVALPLERPRFG